jgi:hypothetical protein
MSCSLTRTWTGRKPRRRWARDLRIRSLAGVIMGSFVTVQLRDGLERYTVTILLRP